MSFSPIYISTKREFSRFLRSIGRKEEKPLVKHLLCSTLSHRVVSEEVEVFR